MLFMSHRVLLKPKHGLGIHSPIWVLEKAYHERGVNRVLLITTSLIQRPNSGHLALWPKDFTRRKVRVSVYGYPCCREHKCSAVHGGLRKEPPCSKGSRTCFATIYNLWPWVSHCLSLVFLIFYKGPGHGSHILWFLWKCQMTLSSQ